MNGYEDIDRNVFFKLREGCRTRGHKAALVKEQCRLDMRNYSFSQRVINELNKLSNDCINASCVNMFKNKIDRYVIRARQKNTVIFTEKLSYEFVGLSRMRTRVLHHYIDDTFFGLLLSQWLSCPFAIWNLLSEMTILLNLVQSLISTTL